MSSIANVSRTIENVRVALLRFFVNALSIAIFSLIMILGYSIVAFFLFLFGGFALFGMYPFLSLSMGDHILSAAALAIVSSTTYFIGEKLHELSINKGSIAFYPKLILEKTMGLILSAIMFAVFVFVYSSVPMLLLLILLGIVRLFIQFTLQDTFDILKVMGMISLTISTVYSAYRFIKERIWAF